MAPQRIIPHISVRAAASLVQTPETYFSSQVVLCSHPLAEWRMCPYWLLNFTHREMEAETGRHLSDFTQAVSGEVVGRAGSPA